MSSDNVALADEVLSPVFCFSFADSPDPLVLEKNRIFKGLGRPVSRILRSKTANGCPGAG